MAVLVGAWHAIRRNAETSQQDRTKRRAREFGDDLVVNLRKLQSRLEAGYVFAKAHGATPPKGSGKLGKRPVVVAPLEDRIVQRAFLDVLQNARELPIVQAVLACPTSIGGIRGRGVDTGLELFQDRVEAGDRYCAGSDIAAFFTKIPRKMVTDFLIDAGTELEFIHLIDSALTVELANEASLSAADRKLFPTGLDGVAQGCPLSALAGNIVLQEFDAHMNERGITCIRYIDDFVLLGSTERTVKKAMASASEMLARYNMTIYDPLTAPTKAFAGLIGHPHEFLGHVLLPGSYPPATGARAKLMAQIDILIAEGQLSIDKAARDRQLQPQDRCYAQTLTAIDNTVRGWRGSFRISNCRDVFETMDKEIDRRLNDFHAYYRARMARMTSVQQRRAMKVTPLTDDLRR